MNKEYSILPKINRNDLIKTKQYPQLFLPLFITDEMNHNHRKIMSKLNTSQQTLLTFYLIDESMRCCGGYYDPANPAENWSTKGGFIQLIYNGYGEYVFEKPFPEIIKTWGAVKISGIIERAKSLYEKHKDKVKKVKTEKELSYLYSEITDFEILDEEYILISEEEKEKIIEYIENNLNEFAVIDERNTQTSYVDKDIKEIEERVRMIEEITSLDK